MKQVFYNGSVYTGKLPLQEAFVVENGRFAAAGSSAEMLAMAGGGDQIADLNGHFVCAGFNDSHMHLLSLGASLNMARLAEHTDSLSGMLAYLRDYAAQHPPCEGAWLRGRGWNQDYFADADRMPDRDDLDSVSTDYPIMITRACEHICVVNSKALEIAGIGADTQSPAGGAIGRDCSGRPDGRLYDNAMNLLRRVLPLPGKEELKEMIRLASRALNTFGVTSCQTDDCAFFRGVPFEDIKNAYRELIAAGELTVRVYEQCNMTTPAALRALMAAGDVTGSGDSSFRIGPLKMLGDGSLGARTAHLSRPYADEPSTCGASLFTPEEMNEMVGIANEAGMQVAVHAIGDACLDMVLDAIEKALTAHPRRDHRHGIVHCQISRADQLERIARLGLHVYAQSIFLDYDNHMAEARVGSELASTSYCWKTLMNSGVSVSNGSDCPVELPNALEGIECAVTRTSLDGTGPFLPEQAFTVQEALDSFTIRSAEASFEETEKGRIEPGFLADFVVLEESPFAVEPRHIHEIRVLETWLGGERVFEAS